MDTGEKRVKPSRFTIRVKLLVIVTATIFVSLSAMIIWATDAFTDESRRVIQNYNLSLARMIGLKLQSDLRNLDYISRVLTRALENSTEEDREFFEQQLFGRNPGYIFFGVAERRPGGLKFIRSFRNADFLKRHGPSPTEFEKQIRENTKLFRGINDKTPMVRNVSSGFRLPVLGVAVPVRAGERKLVALVYLESREILKTFRFSGESELFELMITDPSGVVLVHSKPELALAAANRRDLPIVRVMLGSPIDNGSREYNWRGRKYLGAYQVLEFGGLGVVSALPADKAFAAVFRIQRRNFYVVGIVLALAFLFIVFFARTLSVPIVRLVGAARRVEQGDYHVEIEPASRDEIGILTDAFKSMAAGLEEREKIKHTFGKFVNPELAERALRGELTLGGEHSECAIFFSDLRNFTAMSESRKPAEVVEILNHYFTDMVRCVRDTDGVVDKFIGDAIMAHWGALYSRGNDTENAVNAALMMRKALIEFNKASPEKGRPPLRIGCGINTGPVIAGQIGSEERLEYTVIGDAVNLASRIEYLNKHFGTDILISSASYEKVRGIYYVARMPEISIKGKSKPETVFAVMGRKDDPTTPMSLRALREMVGIEYNSAGAKKQMTASADKLVNENLPDEANVEN